MEHISNQKKVAHNDIHLLKKRLNDMTIRAETAETNISIWGKEYRTIKSELGVQVKLLRDSDTLLVQY